MDNIVLVKNTADNSFVMWFHLPRVGNPNLPWKIMDLVDGGWSIRNGVASGPTIAADRTLGGTWWKQLEISEGLKRSVIQIILDQDIKKWFK